MIEPRPAQLAEEYSSVVSDLLGTYLDLTMASGELATGYMEWDKQRLEELHKSDRLTPETFNLIFSYKGGSREEGEADDLHTTTLHDLIERNTPGGRNFEFLAAMFVVTIYHFWDDHYRGRLASALGKSRDELTHDVFGELRHLRRSIIHSRGRAVPEAKRARILRPFEPGEAVRLEYEDVRQIASEVTRAVKLLAMT
jgi:hypothetical protein